MIYPPLLVTFSTENTENLLMADGPCKGVAETLLQRKPGEKWRPVSYVNTRHPPRVNPMPIYAQELLAVYFSLTKFYWYLIRVTFKLQTDAIALKAIRHSRLSPNMYRWLEFVNSFSFAIEHTPDSSNVISDIMSRSPLQLDPEAVRKRTDHYHCCCH